MAEEETVSTVPLPKTLLLIGGPMGVGKSAVCGELVDLLQPGVYLDGDWCWNMRPFSVTEETKAMVMDNICAMLNRFLGCPELRYVIFGWVMHQQTILDEICSRLPLEGVTVHKLSLLASEDVLRQRLGRDVAAGRRTAEGIGRSLAYLTLYAALNTQKIWTDKLSPRETAERIAALATASDSLQDEKEG